VRAGDESFERLRKAIDELAVGDAAELLSEARAEARARVRSMLSDALAQSMLESAREQLERSSHPAPPAAESATAGTAATAAPAEPAQPATEELAWYVYGVVRASDAGRLGELGSVESHQQVITVSEDDVAAAASRVPLHEFGEAQLRKNLSDMDWVERTARAHESVLEAIRQRATVIPMRMCTVYRTEGGIREMLRRESDALDDALAHLEGKTEWGVKVFASPAASDSVSAVEPEGTTGAAYMERKRRERDRRDEEAQKAEQACGDIHERLSRVAADALVAPPQRPEASGHPGEMALNGVYLVEDASQDAFHLEVEALRREYAGLGLELEATGPWPAYNFVPGAIGAAW